MTGLIITAVVLAVIVVVAVVALRMNASPKARYRRNLRSIRRIREDVRPGDPNATQIGPTPGTFSAGT
jgi:hypothetical protein